MFNEGGMIPYRLKNDFLVAYSIINGYSGTYLESNLYGNFQCNYGIE